MREGEERQCRHKTKMKKEELALCYEEIKAEAEAHHE
jgi:hypothetical protein